MATAYLLGAGRPGLNSLAQAAGLVVTVTLDLVLIPRIGVMGAAIASCFAYLTTTAMLLVFFRVLTHARPPWARDASVLAEGRVPEVSA